MTQEEIAAKAAATAAADAEAKAKAEAEAKLSQNPLKAELEKVQKKTAGKTELEKALFTKQQIDKRIADLQKENGTSEPIDADDNATVTVGMLKQMEKERAAKSSLQLAEDIEDENERELIKHHLQNTIRPSGNPNEDLKTARMMVNAVKNSKLIEEAQRKTQPKNFSSGTGNPAKPVDGVFEPTTEELAYMHPPWNLSKEKILEARKNAQQ